MDYIEHLTSELITEISGSYLVDVRQAFVESVAGPMIPFNTDVMLYRGHKYLVQTPHILQTRKLSLGEIG